MFHLYGMSLKLLWECEWETLVSFVVAVWIIPPPTPKWEISCADPDKLRSLPRLLLRLPGAGAIPVCCCVWFGWEQVDAFFFVGPKPKNLPQQNNSLSW